MVNTAQQGARFERRVINELTDDHGYTCIRSAASKGAVDIVAYGPLRTYELGEEPDAIRLHVQCKLSNPLISPAERTALIGLSLRAGAIPIVCHWAKSETTGLMTVHYRQLTGPGPKDWAPWAPGEDN